MGKEPSLTVVNQDAVDLVDKLEVALRNGSIVDLRTAQTSIDAQPIRQPHLTPLDKAKLMSDAVYAKTGFRPRYVQVGADVIDTQKPVDLPITSLFPALRKRKP